MLGGSLRGAGTILLTGPAVTSSSLAKPPNVNLNALSSAYLGDVIGTAGSCMMGGIRMVVEAVRLIVDFESSQTCELVSERMRILSQYALRLHHLSVMLSRPTETGIHRTKIISRAKMGAKFGKVQKPSPIKNPTTSR